MSAIITPTVPESFTASRSAARRLPATPRRRARHVSALAVVLALTALPSVSLAQRNPKYQLWRTPALLRGANVAVTPTQRPTPETFSTLRAAGANLVQLSADGIQRTDSAYGDDTVAATRLATAVKDATDAGLYVVIGMRTGPGLADVAVEASTPGLQSKLWVSPAARVAFAGMWKRLARIFGPDSMVIGYNLIIEPLPEAAVSGLSTCCARTADSALRSHGIDWPAFADSLTLGIRTVDSLTPILVDATGFSVPAFFSVMRPVSDPYVVYDVHQYEPHVYTHQGTSRNYPVGVVWPGGRFRYWRDENREHTLGVDFLRAVLSPVLDFQRRIGGAPIFVGEFGVNRQAQGAAAFITTETGLFNAYGWHSAMWIWGPFGNMEVTAADSSASDPTRRSILSAYRAYWQGGSGPR